MENNNFKNREQKMPIEKQETAAWANKEKRKSNSNVNIPNVSQVINAKEYVDDNEK